MVVEINRLVRVVVVDGQGGHAHHIQQPDEGNARRNKPRLARPRPRKGQHKPRKQRVEHQPVTGRAHYHRLFAGHEHQRRNVGVERSGKAQRVQQSHTAAGNVLAQSRIEPAIVGQPLLVAKEPDQVHNRRDQ